MCTSGGVTTYFDINPEQQRKIEGLIERKQIPETFNLNGKMVISKDILGFTNDKPSPRLDIKNWDEFRVWAHRQSWYRKHRAKPPASPLPQPVTLLP